MAKVQTAFTPALNGFQFINYFQTHFPVKIPLPFTGPIALHDVVFGLCGGMCFAALDYFNAGKPLPTDTQPDAIDRKLFTYLCERQFDSLQIPVLLKIIEFLLAEDAEIARRMLRIELPKLRRMLDKGQPAVLCLIRTHGLQDATQNHQVVATGYEVSDDGSTLTITLYDPNHPCEEPTITTGLAKQGFSITQSTGERMRGFFILPYTPQTTVPLPVTVMEAAFALPSLQLKWPVDSRIVNQYFGEHPENYRGFGLPGHEGVDLFALSGANVYACADGVVIEAGKRPQDHPYGVQVRIRHMADGQEYHTVYAHLQQTCVKVNQQVKAGEKIGQADNTGNSFGSHLHLTLKQIGSKTSGYPEGIIDPWPFLQGSVTPPEELPPSPSGVTVYTNCQVNLRQQPSTDASVLTSLPVAEALAVLGDAAAIRSKIGQQGQWLQIKTAAGLVGYVAAWLVTESNQEAFPPSGLIVYAAEQVNLRSGPGTAFALLGTMTSLDPLSALGSAETVRRKIGQQGQWLQVQTQSGLRGFVAAWLVHLTGQVPPPSGLTVYPTATINVRARPTTDANVLTVAAPGDALTVLGDKTQAIGQIGQQGQWLNVQTPGKLNGYVAAWLVQQPNTPPPPPGSGLTVYPTADVNMRAQPSANAPRLNGAKRGDALTVVETDLNAARAKIGQQDRWINVQKKDGARGWVAAWYLSAAPV